MGGLKDGSIDSVIGVAEGSTGRIRRAKPMSSDAELSRYTTASAHSEYVQEDEIVAHEYRCTDSPCTILTD